MTSEIFKTKKSPVDVTELLNHKKKGLWNGNLEHEGYF